MIALPPSPLPPWPQVAAGLAAGFTLAALARFVNRHGIGFLPQDTPGGPRKQHARVTPMVGFLLAAGASLWLLLHDALALAGAAALLAATGYADDRGKRRGGLPWRAKAVAQLAAAALVTAAVVPRADLAVWLLAVAFVFVLINALNFLDNMDGVSALVGGLGILLATRGHGALAVAGALFLGFVPWNWPRPGLFLGDGGALALGALLAGAALEAGREADGHLALAPLLAATFVPLLDFAQVVCARLWLGYAPWVGDRRHLTHIATYVGVPAVWVAPLFVALTLAAWVGFSALGA